MYNFVACKWKYNCDDKGELMSGPARIQSVIRFSIESKDNVHVDLVDRLGKNSKLTIKCHRNCVSTYTSQQRLSRNKKREGCRPVFQQTKSENETSQVNFESRVNHESSPFFFLFFLFCPEKINGSKMYHEYRWFSSFSVHFGSMKGCCHDCRWFLYEINAALLTVSLAYS